MDYEFHSLSPWVRWQMIQLYTEIFAVSRLDIREMLAARSEDRQALQRHVESMADVRKFHNKYRAGGLFPDLREKLVRKTSVLPRCYCMSLAAPRSHTYLIKDRTLRLGQCSSTPRNGGVQLLVLRTS